MMEQPLKENSKMVNETVWGNVNGPTMMFMKGNFTMMPYKVYMLVNN